MPRTAKDTSVRGYRPELLKAMNEFIAPCVFASLGHRRMGLVGLDAGVGSDLDGLGQHPRSNREI